MASLSGGNHSKTSPGTQPGTRNHNRGRGYQKSNFRCGHRGLGAFCHRCDQADKLEAAMAASLAGKKKSNGAPMEMARDFMKEIARLRAVSKREQKSSGATINDHAREIILGSARAER
jgi:hypothetical protein